MNNQKFSAGGQMMELMSSIQWQLEALQKNHEQLDEIVGALPNGAIKSVSVYSSSLYIYVKGDKTTLTEVVRALRTRSFITDAQPPGVKDPEWQAKFVHMEDLSYVPIQIHFNSTACVKVQVGTRKRVVEEPIYEVKCDEPIGELVPTEAYPTLPEQGAEIHGNEGDENASPIGGG